MSHKDPEKRREYNRKYYREHPEYRKYIAKKTREYRKEHSEWYKKYGREYGRKRYQLHREKLKAQALAYYNERKDDPEFRKKLNERQRKRVGEPKMEIKRRRMAEAARKLKEMGVNVSLYK